MSVVGWGLLFLLPKLESTGFVDTVPSFRGVAVYLRARECIREQIIQG